MIPSTPVSRALGGLAIAVLAFAPAQAQDCPECPPGRDGATSVFDAARAVFPDLQLSPDLESAFLATWEHARTREVTRCPSPGDVETARFLEPPAPPQGLDDTFPPDDTVTTFVRVFLDTDEDGVYDAGEMGLPDIMVSNGTPSTPLGMGVDFTDASGTYTFETWLWYSRFVFVTVPSGYRATTPFYHRLGTADPDTASFGLVEDPATADPDFRWVQMSDMQVANLLDEGLQNGDDLTEIESLVLPPDFIVVTGDLVQLGDNTIQFQNYLAGVAGHPVPIHHGYGDHDRNDGCLKVVNFEDYIDRPTYYSFDYAGVHFVMFNDFDAADVEGCFVQYPWLYLDIFTARARALPNDLKVVICKHLMPSQKDLDLYHLLSETTNGEIQVVGVFSGHWHGSRVREVQGIFDVNTPPSRYSGIDKSSRGFRIVDMSDGAVSTIYREAGIVEHLRIVHPADEDTVLVDQVEVRVNAYNSTAAPASVDFWVTGPPGTSPPMPMSEESPWTWVGTWDADGQPNGSYTVHVEVTPAAGPVFGDSVRVDLLRGGFVNQPDPYTDWPSYKFDAAGTGHTPVELAPPPLRLAWTRHLGSPVNVPSPGVAGGRLYIGTSNISTVGEARMLCLDASTGNLIWEVPARNDVKSTPAIADGSVYFTNSTGTLFALDAVSGDILWQAQLGDSLNRWEMTSPTVYEGVVYAGGPTTMTAADAASGSVIWQRSVSTSPDADFVPSIYAAPAVNDDVAIFTGGRGIYAYDRTSGDPLWSIAGSSRRLRSVALVDSVAWTAGITFGAQFLQGYHALTGDLLYDGASILYESTSAPVVGPGPGGDDIRVIVANAGNQSGTTGNPTPGRLQSFLPPSTTADWSVWIGDLIASSAPYKRDVSSINSTPAWVGNRVYFGADDGLLRCVTAASGALEWSYDLGIPLRSSPAVAGNMLFVNGSDGTLYAFVSTFLAPAAADAGATPGLVTRLRGAAPNPFNPSTTIRFDLGRTGAELQPVTLKIYDPSGRLVRTLLDQGLEAGHHAVAWDGRDDRGRQLGSSVYFYELIASGERFRDKLVLLK